MSHKPAGGICSHPELLHHSTAVNLDRFFDRTKNDRSLIAAGFKDFSQGRAVETGMATSNLRARSLGAALLPSAEGHSGGGLFSDRVSLTEMSRQMIDGVRGAERR